MSAAAVVAAAGEGVRFGAEDGPRKQFRTLAGRPVVERACAALRADPGVASLVLVLPADVAASPPPWARAAADRIVEGGPTRRASVARGVGAAPDGADVLLVHDGVRPLASSALVRRVREAAGDGPVVPVLPVRDTVKTVDEDGTVVRTLDRGRLRRVQTPQGFPAAMLRRAHRRAREEGWSATDDAGLCERAGMSVATVAGERRNLKLTTRDDLLYAEWLLEGRGADRADRGAGGTA